MIKRIGTQFFVYNHEGNKKLSKGFSSLKKAKKRLKEIEFFAHRRI
jgi:hypothetical protein